MILRDVLVPQSLAGDGLGGDATGDCLRGDLHVRDGRVTRMTPSAQTPRPRMVVPKLVEAHCHLDKCHSFHRLGPVGGDLRKAIETQAADRDNWTEDDLRARAGQGLQEAAMAGCSALRTHIDWRDTASPPRAWSVVTELAQGMAGMTVQCAALMGVDQMADATFCNAVARGIAPTGGVLGAFVLDHADRTAGLRNMFDAAARHGLPLDFHADEGLGDFDGVEAIADMAIETDFAGPILCGHACGLMDKDTATLARVIDKLARAGIAVCALPTTNLYLQGRAHGTPDRRGLTRLRELQAGGVPIVLASDNVADAFCPVGRHDPMEALHLGVMGAHLDPPFGRWLPAVTTHAAAALGLRPVLVKGSSPRDLLLSTATTTADLVAGRGSLTPLHEGPT
ncbi:amidohydrolase family protein [Sulfitobacter sabulilitoris]|nr:amidohydrolase family protein [Sulfitobacter sabulilitoris]